jgi:lactoylglutathione lyase
MRKHIPFYLLLSVLLTAFTINHFQQQKPALLNHVALSVVNLGKSTTFYKNIIEVDSIAEPFKDGKHTWFRIGERSQLHLIESAKEVKAHDKGTHICFTVPSIEDVISRLQKANIPYENWLGASSSVTTRPDGVKQIYFTDPDGYWVEINNDRY